MSVDFYLERMEKIRSLSANGEAIYLDATLITFPDFSFCVDYFFDLKLAIRFESHVRKTHYEPPRVSEGQVLREGAKLEKKDNWLGVGLVFHYL